MAIWTPDEIRRQLSERLRGDALASQGSRQSRWRFWLSRGWGLVRSDLLRAAFSFALAGSLGSGAILVAVSWPPGGGSGESNLVISQGAGLVFIVILMGLLAAPLEAARAVGIGTRLVAEDVGFWIGFSLLALLPLSELLLAWSHPDRLEELASVFLTTAGLTGMVLVVRRLLRLSDPAVHLDLAAARAARAVRKIVQRGRRESLAALEVAQVETQLAQDVARHADPTTQRAIAEVVRVFLNLAREYDHRGDWGLAMQSLAASRGATREYLANVEALYAEDSVLIAFGEGVDDLHQTSAGPSQRSLSAALVDSLASIGLSVAAFPSADGHNNGLSSPVFWLERMLVRRLRDDKSADSARAAQALGDLARVAIQHGSFWTGAHGAGRLFSTGADLSNLSVAHVAIPAWRSGLDCMVALAAIGPPIGPMVFGALESDFLSALRKLEELPSLSFGSAVSPLLRGADPGPTLPAVFHELWRSDESFFEELANLGRSVSWQLTRLVEAADEESTARLNSSEDVADVLYQWIVAATSRAVTLPSESEGRSQAIDSIANTIGWMRALLVRDGKVQSSHNLERVLQVYFSAWQHLLFAAEGEPACPTKVSEQVEQLFQSITTESIGQLPEVTKEGLHLLAGWLAEVGFVDVAETANRAAARLPAAETARWGPPSGWGMSGAPFFTYRGMLISPINSRVEERFGTSYRSRFG